MEQLDDASSISGGTKWKRILYDANCLSTEEEKKRFLGAFELQIGTTTLRIEQAPVKSNNSVGLTVWDSSIVLAKLLERKYETDRSFLDGKRVIELGAGCGLPGMAAICCGAKVTLTDVDRVLDQLRLNAASNFKECKYPFDIAELKWGKTKLNPFNPPFDVVLGADLVYHKRVILPLLKTAYKLSDERTLFYFAFETHCCDAAEAFWNEAPKFFTVNKVATDELHSFYHDDDIEVLLLQKKLASPQIPIQENNSNDINTGNNIAEGSDNEDYSEDWGSDDEDGDDDDDDDEDAEIHNSDAET